MTVIVNLGRVQWSRTRDGEKWEGRDGVGGVVNGEKHWRKYITKASVL